MSKPTQYDESPQLIRAIQDRMREKSLRKAEYYKMMSDPYRWSFEAAPVDMGILRFEAQRTFTGSYRFFKPTPRTFLWHICTVWIPIIGFTMLSENYRAKREHTYRTGQVAYRDKPEIFSK